MNTLFEQPRPREGQEQGERESDGRTNRQRGREQEGQREKERVRPLSPIQAACPLSCRSPPPPRSLSSLASSLSLIEVFL